MFSYRKKGGYTLPNKVVKVLLMRRGELCKAELEALKASFPDKTLEVKRIDPEDYVEHAEICEDEQPDAVILAEKPLPTLAMERGFAHIVFLPGIGFRKLKRVIPEFEEFTPSGE